MDPYTILFSEAYIPLAFPSARSRLTRGKTGEVKGEYEMWGKLLFSNTISSALVARK
jgi:hypothetical protein